MKINTPLPDVAYMLGTETAAELLDYPSDTQIAVLDYVRSIIVGWEERGVILDPITMEVVLHDFVRTLAGLHSQNHGLASVLSKVSGALIERLEQEKSG